VRGTGKRKTGKKELTRGEIINKDDLNYGIVVIRWKAYWGKPDTPDWIAWSVSSSRVKGEGKAKRRGGGKEKKGHNWGGGGAKANSEETLIGLGRMTYNEER